MRLVLVIRPLVCSGILVSLTAIAVLVSFHHVVRGGVLQGEATRLATAMEYDALWRCKAQRDPRVRADCLLQLKPMRISAP